VCTHYNRQPIRLAGKSEISKSGYGAIFRCAQESLKVIFSVVVAIFFCFVESYAQGPQLPAVNLGNTTFLDGVAAPGWVVEEIGAGVHDNRAADITGQIASKSPDVSSATALTHIAWISHARTLGGWPGAETLFSGVWVNAGSLGSGRVSEMSHSDRFSSGRNNGCSGRPSINEQRWISTSLWAHIRQRPP
jgi:hypothetical protein